MESMLGEEFYLGESETPTIVMDTTVLRSDPSMNKATSKLLIQIAKQRVAYLAVPWIVQEEFLAARTEELFEDMEELSRAMRQVSRKGIYSQLHLIDDEGDEVSLAEDDAYRIVQSRWKAFVDTTHLEIIQVSESHARLAWLDYFSGNPPFKKSRNRKDIPDAFIAQVVRDFVEGTQPTIFVSGDNGLRNAVREAHYDTETPPRLETYTTLKELWDSPTGQELKYRMGIDYAADIDIDSDELSELAKTKLRPFLESWLIGGLWEDDRFLFSESVAIVDRIDSIRDLELSDGAERSIYGEGLFVIPFETEVRIRFRSPSLSSDLDHITISADSVESIMEGSESSRFQYGLAYLKGDLWLEVNGLSLDPGEDFVGIESMQIVDIKVD